MDEQRLPAREPDDDVLAAAVDRVDAVAAEHRGHEGRVVGARKPRVVDPCRGDPLPRGGVRKAAPLGLDLRELRHEAGT